MTSKATFSRIDNGYMEKPSYKCSNGLIIEAGDSQFDVYKYYVGDNGFDYLKDAKQFCINQ